MGTFENVDPLDRAAFIILECYNASLIEDVLYDDISDNMYNWLRDYCEQTGKKLVSIHDGEQYGIRDGDYIYTGLSKRHTK